MLPAARRPVARARAPGVVRAVEKGFEQGARDAADGARDLDHRGEVGGGQREREERWQNPRARGEIARLARRLHRPRTLAQRGRSVRETGPARDGDVQTDRPRHDRRRGGGRGPKADVESGRGGVHQATELRDGARDLRARDGDFPGEEGAVGARGDAGEDRGGYRGDGRGAEARGAELPAGGDLVADGGERAVARRGRRGRARHLGRGVRRQLGERGHLARRVQARVREPRARTRARAARESAREGRRERARVDEERGRRARSRRRRRRAKAAVGGSGKVPAVLEDVDHARAARGEGGRRRRRAKRVRQGHATMPRRDPAVVRGRRVGGVARWRQRAGEGASRPGASASAQPGERDAVAHRGAARARWETGRRGPRERPRGGRAHGEGVAGVPRVRNALGGGGEDGAAAAAEIEIRRRAQAVRQRPGGDRIDREPVLARPQDGQSARVVQPRGDAEPRRRRPLGRVL
mmetsp:Transcript_2317/g.7452  ORF Transcript_2317/g.7452 Transcript_2317/m.7452 type:complete len:468 (-) Transcript_2317:1386-2789(-)